MTLLIYLRILPFGNYVFKVNNKSTKTRCEIYFNLTTKTPEWRHWHRSGIFIVNFKHVLHLVLVFLLSALSKYMPAGSWYICFWFWPFRNSSQKLIQRGIHVAYMWCVCRETSYFMLMRISWYVCYVKLI